MLFIDGTGNDVRTRTNVRRLYEMITSNHRPEVLTFYDPGVGTGASLRDKYLGGPFAYGFQRSLVNALTFLVENWRAGDEINLFGFSRGAFGAGVLATLLTRCGLPNLSQTSRDRWTERHERARAVAQDHYKEIHQAELASAKVADRQLAGCRKDPPELRAAVWRATYWRTLQQKPYWSHPERPRPEIAVLGLWDPVESVVGTVYPVAKVAWSVSDVSEFGRHKGHRFHAYAFDRSIKKCLMALSLDEQRQTFLAELPDHAQGQPAEYEFVWFAGDHSDIGGGHDGDKDLAGVSMNWLLERVGPHLFGPGAVPPPVYEDIKSPRHDLSVGPLYRRSAFRVRGEILGSAALKVKPDPAQHLRGMPLDACHLAPVRHTGWKMKVHHSVYERMEDDSDFLYVPGSEWEFINLVKQSYDAPRATPGRNPQGQYCPRPFRALPAVRASTGAWVERQWDIRKIRDAFETV
ncbi:MAG: DUF2235 domain-containing protein [Verrucomicrobia bacterium]|nr:DUF2235 domain-containing protein [Verrucomicrobiota bacterium]